MDDDGDVRMQGIARTAIPQVIPNSGASAESRAFLDQLELRNIGAEIVIPTDDNEVRARLRQLGEPITYFGEDKGDRRDRLRNFLAEKQREGVDIKSILGDGATVAEDEDEEEFYTEGGPELRHARKKIADFSLARSKERVDKQRLEAERSLQDHVKNRRQVFDRVCKFEALGTQSGFNRPVSCTKISKDSKNIVAADWSGVLKLFSVPSLEETRTYEGHSGKIGGVAWNPMASSDNTVNFVSGGIDGDIKLWALDRDQPLGVCKGHESQVNKVDVHPSGRYIGSPSHDLTWRLWDIETQTELLCQDGHAKEVIAFGFQDDGALAASAGMDAIGRVWDLRTGKTIMILDGHIQPIYSLDFSPNGYQLATAAGDNTVMVWDLRQVRSISTIAAHTKVVSDVKFYKGKRSYDGLNESGTFLATSSYDQTVKIWSADNWVLKHKMEDANKCMSIDISQDQQFITSGRWDRYVKLWYIDS